MFYWARIALIFDVAEQNADYFQSIKEDSSVVLSQSSDDRQRSKNTAERGAGKTKRRKDT